MMKIIFLVLFFFFGSSQDCSGADTLTYCVGSSYTLKTIQSGINQILYDRSYTGSFVSAGGVKLYLEQGNYEEHVVIFGMYGTEENPITIQPFPSATVNVKPGPTDSGALSIYSGVDWLIISNGENGGKLIFETRETDPRFDTGNDEKYFYPLILANDAHISLGPFEIISPSNHYHESYLITLYADEKTKIIKGVTFSGIFAEAISVTGNTNRGTYGDGYKAIIQDCKFIQDTGIINLNSTSPIFIRSGFIKIENNYFFRKSFAGSYSIFFYSGSNSVVQNNIFEVDDVNSQYAFSSIGIGSYEFSSTEILIQNNHFFAQQPMANAHGLLTFTHNGITKIRIINNIIERGWNLYYNGITFLIYGETACTECEFKDNIIEKTTSNIFYSGGDSWDTSNNKRGSEFLFTNFQGDKPFPYFMQTTKSFGTKYEDSPERDANGYKRNETNLLNRGPYEGCPGSSKIVETLRNIDCECINDKFNLPTCLECADPKYNYSTNCETLLETETDPDPDTNNSTVGQTVLVVVGVIFVFIVILLGIAAALGLTLFFIFKKKGDLNKRKSAQKTIKEMDNLEAGENKAKMILSKDFFKIEMGDIHVKKKIGKGGFATVFKANYANMEVAFKCFQTSHFYRQTDQNANDFDAFETELKLFSSLTHENIPRFYGASLQPPRVGIVMEYCGNGNLKDYLEKNQLTLKERIKLIKGVVKGMAFVHSKNLIHRDLKPENILLTESNPVVPKICDFGLSRLDEKSEDKTQAIGTNLYIAPEVFLGKKYDKSADVFSFGIILYCIVRNKFTIFKGASMQHQIKISQNTLRPDLNLIDKEIKTKNKWLVHLMKNCWAHEPSNRYTFEEILELFENNEIV